MGHKTKLTPKKAAEYKRLAAQAPRPAAMTDKEAEAEALRLWGERARAWHPAYARAGDLRHCCVGIANGEVNDEWIVYGHGRTFIEAFADAKARKH